MEDSKNVKASKKEKLAKVLKDNLQRRKSSNIKKVK